MRKIKTGGRPKPLASKPGISRNGKRIYCKGGKLLKNGGKIKK